MLASKGFFKSFGSMLFRLEFPLVAFFAYLLALVLGVKSLWPSTHCIHRLNIPLDCAISRLPEHLAFLNVAAL